MAWRSHSTRCSTQDDYTAPLPPASLLTCSTRDDNAANHASDETRMPGLPLSVSRSGRDRMNRLSLLTLRSNFNTQTFTSFSLRTPGWVRATAASCSNFIFETPPVSAGLPTRHMVMMQRMFATLIGSPLARMDVVNFDAVGHLDSSGRYCRVAIIAVLILRSHDHHDVTCFFIFLLFFAFLLGMSPLLSLAHFSASLEDVDSSDAAECSEAACDVDPAR